MTMRIDSSLIISSVVMICSLSIIVHAVDTDYKMIDSNNVPDVLSMLASATQANYEKIDTWKGQISHMTISTTRGEKAAEYLSKFTEAKPDESINELQRLYYLTINYEIDTKSDKFFSISKSTEPYIYIEPDKSKSYTANWSPDELIFLATPEHEIKMIPLDTSINNVVINRLARKLPRGSFRMTDPRDIFHIGSKTLWLTLSLLSQHLKTPDIEKYDIVIKEISLNSNTAYRIEIFEPNEDYHFQVLVLSGDAGFNRTYIENWYDKDSLMSKTITEFINIEGVFLPKKWEMLQYYKDGGLMRQEINTVEHQQINTPILNDTFSTQKYLTEGSEFRDRIAGKKYKYENNKLVEMP